MKKEHVVRGAIILCAFFVILCLTLTIVTALNQDVNIAETEPVIETTEYSADFVYIPQTSSERCKEEIIKCKEYLATLHSAQEIERIEEIIYTHECDLELLLDQEAIQAKWDARKKEYPVATEVWLYMQLQFGWNDTVCAGVLGNIMAEIGGGTLNFNNWDHDKNTYGMFQWLGGRKKSIKKIYGDKPTIEEQLEFMYDELYGTDGVRKQVTDAQRSKILNGASPEAVAMSFCRYFERPGGTGLSRKKYARIAYNYFVD